MSHMETITRRKFQHEQAHILRRIAQTGQPVRIQGREGPAFVVSLEPEVIDEDPMDRLLREGKVYENPNYLGDHVRFRDLPKLDPSIDIEALLAEEEDWR